MAIHPHVGERLHKEVLEHCGPRAPVTYECIKDLKYSTSSITNYSRTADRLLNISAVCAVINETPRLFPPVPLNIHESWRSSCLLPPSDPSYPDNHRPLYMSGDTTIVYLPLLVQRNKVLWGPDADEFYPEQWLQPDRIAKFVANPAMFAPFSAGPRIVSFNYVTRVTLSDNTPSALARTMLTMKCRTFSSDCSSNLTDSCWHLRYNQTGRCLRQTGRAEQVGRPLRKYGPVLQWHFMLRLVLVFAEPNHVMISISTGWNVGPLP